MVRRVSRVLGIGLAVAFAVAVVPAVSSAAVAPQVETPAQPGAGGGYMSTGLVVQAWNHYRNGLKGLMTWSINWDGSKGWTFGNNVRSLQHR